MRRLPTERIRRNGCRRIRNPFPIAAEGPLDILIGLHIATSSLGADDDARSPGAKRTRQNIRGIRKASIFLSRGPRVRLRRKRRSEKRKANSIQACISMSGIKSPELLSRSVESHYFIAKKRNRNACRAVFE